MDITTLKKLMNNQEFVNHLLDLQTAQDVQIYLKDNGIDLSEGQINEIRDFLIRYDNGTLSLQEKEFIEQVSQDNDELSDDQLENICGGIAGFVGLIIVVGVIAGCVGFGYAVKKARW